MAKKFFFSWPGGFGTSGFDLGKLIALLIDIPHHFIGGSKRSTSDAMLCRAGSRSQCSADAKGINGRTSLQQVQNLPLVQIPAGEDADICQTGGIQLGSYILTIAHDVSTIESNSREYVTKCLLRSQCHLNGGMNGLTWIIGIQQQGIAIVGLGNGCKGLFLGGKEFNQGMG